MIKHVDAIVLFTTRTEECVKLYRALGLTLTEEQHEGGPRHWACDLGEVHFAIYGAKKGGDAVARPTGGATQIGFRVEDLGFAFAAAKSAGAEVVAEPEDVPWGRRAIVLDPDGRAVELNQR